MSMKQPEIFLGRFNEANVSVIGATKFLPQIYLFLYQNVLFYIPLFKFLMECLIL